MCKKQTCRTAPPADGFRLAAPKVGMDGFAPEEEDHDVEIAMAREEGGFAAVVEALQGAGLAV